MPRPGLHPAGAYYDANLAEFILPYDWVRCSPNPDDAIRTFAHSAYEAVAELGGWDRAALESRSVQPRRPRHHGSHGRSAIT